MTVFRSANSVIGTYSWPILQHELRRIFAGKGLEDVFFDFSNSEWNMVVERLFEVSQSNLSSKKGMVIGYGDIVSEKAEQGKRFKSLHGENCAELFGV